MEEIILQKQENTWLICVLENNKIVEKLTFSDDLKPKIGDYFLGTIKSINKKMGAIFVDIGFEKQGYLETKMLDKYKVGDKLLVEVKKEETKQKGPKLAICRAIQGTNIEASSSKIVEFFVRNFCKKTTKKVYINDSNIFKMIQNKLWENEINNIELAFSEKANFIEDFGMVGELEKVDDRKVWLKSGGYIVIDKTEAFWAIDVNSGKYEGKKGEGKPKIVLKINKEAAIEVMKQIRLKNIGGIIVVDFINMENNEDKKEIISLMKEEAKRDRSVVSIYNFSKLGLLELTRKKL